MHRESSQQATVADCLLAHAQNKGLESAMGLDQENAEGQMPDGNSKKRRRQALVHPLEAQGAAAPKGAPGEKKKRGRPAKGTFTVTEDSDLLDQVAKRPAQVLPVSEVSMLCLALLGSASV